MKRATLPIAVLSVLSIVAPRVSGVTNTLTLEEAVTLALENNPSLQSSSLEARKVLDKLAAARTRQFPGFSFYALGAQQLRSFDFTLEKGVLGEYGSTGPLPSEDVHLKTPLAPTGVLMARVAQPITSLIRIRRNMAAIATGVDLAKEQTRAERQKLVREVRSVYYNLQQLESSLHSIQETSNLYQEVEALTSKYVLQQVALKGDLLDSQMRLAKSRHNEVQLLNQQAAAKEALNRLMGRDLLTEFTVQPVLEATSDEIGLDEARGRALKSRPEIRQALLRQDQAEKEYRAKKAESIPDISAEFNNLTFLNWGRFMPTQSTSIGVSLSWEPFDWGRKKHEAAEKQRSTEQARLTQKDTERLVLADVNDKFRQLRLQRAELGVARLSQETAIERLRVTKHKYLVQAVLVKDVLQAQASLEQSNAEYQQALAAFWNARADFDRAIGED